ncbi:DUF5797 family protein [Halocalculus aciditolerans]|uniref:Uncharacterized protein n=1 Tax=Halocalculus aciditolerans TaxID=1383812 RepID=A0A830FKW0_9EURY|nr:DUF5797 family protein [Halocalculus aciditolerans]GGL62494.1 hypothetical protein GCM10009039_20660 [Halocalculus aciditolerans]
MSDDGELGAEARERLEDLVELQPTKNKVLQDRWGMESGSDVHQYLEGELKDYYYRDEDSLIRPTAAATALVEGRELDVVAVHMTEDEHRVFEVLNAPDDESESVVAILHKVREAFDDPELGTKPVKSALQSLKRKGVVDVVYRTVPTYRLAVERERVERTND